MNRSTNRNRQIREEKLKEKRGIWIFVFVIVAILAVLVVYRVKTGFVFESDLDQPVLTIDETVVTLKEISYYIMEVENTGDEYARIYNPDNPLEYWGLYMNEETSAGYVSDLARMAAMNYCIRDNIYYLEAQKAGVELTEEEREDVQTDAKDYYANMSQRQKEVTQLLPEDLEIILEKITLTRKYMLQLSSQEEDVSALEAVTVHYDVGGDYYEGLKNSYTVKVNERIWEQIRPGHITIN